MSTTPIYDQVCADSTWTPDDLRAPYDLDDVIARSYERVLVRMHLVRQIEKRARAKKNRRVRTTRHLP